MPLGLEHSQPPTSGTIDNNVYVQIALVMLIGMAAKNAIRPSGTKLFLTKATR